MEGFMRFAQRPGPVVVAPKVFLNTKLSYEDLGLYVRVMHAVAGSPAAPDVDQVVRLLLDGRAGPAPECSPEALKAKVESLAAAGVLPLEDADAHLTEAEWCAKYGGWPQL
ncbi:hypothetical protein [Bacillus cereus]|uniref:hypothetical protein n=1 Tax=Bacillus cereus TaxID=1396 RepID=UPI003CFE6754